MGKECVPERVKLIAGFIYRDSADLASALERMQARFGGVDSRTGPCVFDHTRYYEQEMGSELLREFASFKRLIRPDALVDVKRFTNRLERRFSDGTKRRVNIDPGYLGLPKLVLATTKDFAHRVYLGQGIFAEVTLTYTDKRFSPHAWTYPDYRTRAASDFFMSVRETYVKQIAK